MRRYTGIWCLVWLCVLSVLGAQQGGSQKKRRYVLIPPEKSLLVIASQPDCPLQFENARSFYDLDGGGGVDFQLRNRGTKPIRSLSYAIWNTRHAGWVLSWPRIVTNEWVRPGQLVPLGHEISKDDIVPLTDELRDEHKLRGPMEGLVILMVVKVTFTDGSVYDAGPAFKALQAYTARLNEFDEEEPKDEEK